MPYRRRRVSDGERFTMDQAHDELQKRIATPKDRTAARRDYMRTYMAERRLLKNGAAFYAEIVHAAKVKLAELNGRPAGEKVACPWARFPDHDAGCSRCNDTGSTTVGMLRIRYGDMAETYGVLA